MDAATMSVLISHCGGTRAPTISCWRSSIRTRSSSRAFVHYNIETKDGRSLSGIIQSESANGFTLVQGGGVQQMLLRGEIAEIRASSLSLMPEGLEQGITPTEMNDLIAYLKAPPPSR
jgi:putative heme-binding domain-containing protein